ncbi:hypothetical protein Fmac_006883 [Flemingia macrophylla]|uniref:GDSL esterase/lipase n=1 Tax=Flemingia macrophylla TaxID=520843 RepID=A0ABD1NBW3_9FABA
MQLQLQLFLLYSLSFFLSASAGCGKPPVLFVFGDSNSDTGGAAAAGIGFPIGFPHGRTFFHRPSCRVSDGRLLIDLLCQSLNTSLLVPYLDALSGTSFTNGANFAVVGSSTLPKNVAFSLYIQVTQFRRFKDRTLQLLTAGARNLINDEGFRDALYLIDIGQNDLEASFSRNLTYAHVLKKIPAFISEIENAVKVSLAFLRLF